FILLSVLRFIITSLHFFFYSSLPCCDLHSFPTRRSSDLGLLACGKIQFRLRVLQRLGQAHRQAMQGVNDGNESLEVQLDEVIDPDRKSTRLNSSHVSISYAVFCLKKKRLII